MKGKTFRRQHRNVPHNPEIKGHRSQDFSSENCIGKHYIIMFVHQKKNHRIKKYKLQGIYIQK